MRKLALRGIRLIQGEEGAAPVTDAGQETQSEPQSQGNPAWADIQSELDEISFSRIRPKLEEWDNGVQQRLSSVTEKYKWADEISRAGFQPEQVVQAIQAAQMLQTQPEVIYEKLREFLEENGRLPNKQELADKVEEDENEPEDDPRISALAQQQEQMREFLIMQENQRQQAQADAELETEISQLRAKHPEFDDSDMQEIISRAALKAQLLASRGIQQIPTLEEAAQDYLNNVRNRILSAQRPGDSAPKLVPTNGGVPASGVAPGTLGSLSKKQTEDLLADIVRRDNARG